jgi:predicted ArsR family transcriptional regulator
LGATEGATYRALAGESRRALLAALGQIGRALDAAEAGAAIGLHPNTARVHLDLLCSAGLLKRRTEQRSRRGRPRVLYEAARTEAGDGTAGRSREREDEVSYRELARLLAHQLSGLPDIACEAVQAGRQWAVGLRDGPLPTERLSVEDTVGVVAGVLSRLGFDPETDADALRVLLHRCPLVDVARENRSLVCGIHFEMLKATIERLDTPLAVVGVEPFVSEEPTLCVVHLGSQTLQRPAEPSPGTLLDQAPALSS